MVQWRNPRFYIIRMDGTKQDITDQVSFDDDGAPTISSKVYVGGGDRIDVVFDNEPEISEHIQKAIRAAISKSVQLRLCAMYVARRGRS